MEGRHTVTVTLTIIEVINNILNANKANKNVLNEALNLASVILLTSHSAPHEPFHQMGIRNLERCFRRKKD